MNETIANIFEIQRMSTEDGPGIRTTVFFKQCPLRCAWCHNPESITRTPQLEWFKHKCIGCNTCIKTCQEDALHFDEAGLHISRDKCNSCGDCARECPSTALHMFGQAWNVSALFEEVNKDKVYYVLSKGGITVSGGEPSIQLDFLLDFLKKCKDEGIATALDTCGHASRSTFEKLLPFVDLVLLDIKEIDPVKHKQFTGVSNDLILENAKWMSVHVRASNKAMWIRTPVIPHYTATEENVKGIGEFIVRELDNIPERWDLLTFNNLCISKYERLDMEWPLRDEPLMEKDEIEKLHSIAKSTGVKNVQWSGLTKKKD
jgi:pyruvate formate lyase activating enzyme